MGVDNQIGQTGGKPSYHAAAGIPDSPEATQVDTWIAQNTKYAPYIAIPEIYDAMVKVIRAGTAYVPGVMEDAIVNTTWWRTKPQSERVWEARKVTEGPTVVTEVYKQGQNILAEAARFGVSMSGTDANTLAEQSLREAWTPQQLSSAIVGFSAIGTTGVSSVATAGLIGQNQQAAKQLAAKYGIRISDAEALTIARSIVENNVDPTTLQARFSQQARGLYPWMANLLDIGVTPESYFDPLRQAMARELELPTDAIDFTDSRWSSMMQLRDPKTNEMRPASIEEARLNVRKDPRWAQTQGAQDLMASLTMGLARRFGYA